MDEPAPVILDSLNLDSSELSPAEVRELLSLARENNKMLRQMQFWGRVAFWFKAVVWTVVLVLPVLLYSYFAPFITSFTGGSVGKTGSTSLFGYPSPDQIQKAIHPGG